MTENWITPLNIPTNKEGEYEIIKETLKAGERALLINSRCLLLGGQKAEASYVTYDIDTQWHKLIGPEGTWMTDLPIEHRQMKECIKSMKGRILIGGLGLGLASSLLFQKKTVKHIDVVEIRQEVIQLVSPHIDKSRLDSRGHWRLIVDVIYADLFEYLKEYQGKPYDYAFYDIWQSDSETTFHNVVIPLLQLSKGKVKHRPVCWNENVMRGQLLQGLMSRYLFLKPEVLTKFPDQKKLIEKHPPWEPLDGPGKVYWNWAVPFWKWYKDINPSQELFQKAAQYYTDNYGWYSNLLPLS